MRLPFGVRIGYCGTRVAFICLAQACRSVSKGELTAPSCVMPCCVVLLQRGVVVADRFVAGFEVELWHTDIVADFG